MKCTQEEIRHFNETGKYLFDETFLREVGYRGYTTYYGQFLFGISYHLDKYHTVTTEFFREYRDNWDWDYISRNQILTEEQLEEFQDKVVWKQVRSHYNLSEQFKEKWKDKLFK